MKKMLMVIFLLSVSGCSVLKSPSSWDVEPLVIDEEQVNYLAISNASSGSDLIAQGDLIRIRIQSLISITRTNLDRTSGGNYGAGLLAAAVGLSGLHSDALLGAGYLAGTHVALSNRLSPVGYMQQLQRSSSAFYCLNNLGLNYANTTEKVTNAVGVANFSVSDKLVNLGYSASLDSSMKIDLQKFKQTYLRALDLSQEKLDAQISLTLPADIQNQLIQASKDAAKSEIEIDELDDSKSLKEFLIEHEKLDSELLACIAII
jgi:hypothetical protein